MKVKFLEHRTYPVLTVSEGGSTQTGKPWECFPDMALEGCDPIPLDDLGREQYVDLTFWLPNGVGMIITVPKGEVVFVKGEKE